MKFLKRSTMFTILSQASGNKLSSCSKLARKCALYAFVVDWFKIETIFNHFHCDWLAAELVSQNSRYACINYMKFETRYTLVTVISVELPQLDFSKLTSLP